jgi:hypothetical protein
MVIMDGDAIQNRISTVFDVVASERGPVWSLSVGCFCGDANVGRSRAVDRMEGSLVVLHSAGRRNPSGKECQLIEGVKRRCNRVRCSRCEGEGSAWGGG